MTHHTPHPANAKAIDIGATDLKKKGVEKSKIRFLKNNPMQ